MKEATRGSSLELYSNRDPLENFYSDEEPSGENNENKQEE
jgi:hypothetical protein